MCPHMQKILLFYHLGRKFLSFFQAKGLPHILLTKVAVHTSDRKEKVFCISYCAIKFAFPEIIHIYASWVNSKNSRLTFLSNLLN